MSDLPHMPDVPVFLLRSPLYDKYARPGYAVIKSLLLDELRYDNYCVDCDDDSIFVKKASVSQLYPETSGRFGVVMRCLRDAAHEYVFYLELQSAFIRKIGQFPSLADLHTADVKQYRKLLGPTRYGEFTRGIGLAAHGIGIGSFVYLRRVFEGLVEEAHKAAALGADFDEQSFQKSRMDERILRLKDHLPAFLVEHRGLYGILSSGVHELSEEECLLHFDAVRSGIQVILDEKLIEEFRRARVARASADIAKVQQRLAAGSDTASDSSS